MSNGTDQTSSCCPNALRLCADVMDDDDQPCLPDLRQGVTPRFRTDAGNQAKSAFCALINSIASD